jgi:hypothetical protein
MQLTAEAHETPFSQLCTEPAGAGVAWTVHFEPFQVSAKVLLVCLLMA